jgi:hypothetical protein
VVQRILRKDAEGNPIRDARRRIDGENPGVGRSQLPCHRLEGEIVGIAGADEAPAEPPSVEENVLLAGDGPEDLGPLSDLGEQAPDARARRAGISAEDLLGNERHAHRRMIGGDIVHPDRRDARDVAELLDRRPDLGPVCGQIFVELQTARGRERVQGDLIAGPSLGIDEL